MHGMSKQTLQNLIMLIYYGEVIDIVANILTAKNGKERHFNVGYGFHKSGNGLVISEMTYLSQHHGR